MKKYFLFTKSDNLKYVFQAILIGTISTAILTMTAYADSIDKLGDRPITVSERQFVESVINKVESTFPNFEGEWERKTQIFVGGDIYHRDTRQGDIYEGYNVVPVPMNIRIDFQQQTTSQVQQIKSARQHAVSSDDLMKQMMQAAANNDEKAIERLSQQMAALQSGAYKKNMGDLLNTDLGSKREKGKKFYVQILINDGGETIGKKYEVSENEGTSTFLIKRKEQSEYKYYLGQWQVSNTNEGNVAIHLSEAMKAEGNHLKALAVSVNIIGPSTVVDGYVHDHVELQGLRNIMN